MRPRDPAKRRRILDSALALVGKQGLAGLSMEEVAGAAGVAIGTLYVYFENKEALLAALYVDTKLGFARAVLDGAEGAAPVRIAFERMCVAYLEYVAKNRAAIVFSHQYKSSPFFREQARRETESAVAPLFELLERGKAEGLLKDLETPLMIALLQGMLGEAAAHAAGASRKERDARYAAVARVAWDALKA